MSKLEHRFFLNSFSKYDFEGSLDKVIEALQALKQDGQKIEIEWDTDYDGNVEYNLYEVRLETDVEYNKRLENETRQKKLREARDRELLKELKEKYDNK